MISYPLSDEVKPISVRGKNYNAVVLTPKELEILEKEENLEVFSYRKEGYIRSKLPSQNIIIPDEWDLVDITAEGENPKETIAYTLHDIGIPWSIIKHISYTKGNYIFALVPAE